MDDLRRLIQESIAGAMAAAMAGFRDEQQALVESAVERALSRCLPSSEEGEEQWAPTGEMAAILGVSPVKFRNWARNAEIKALGRPLGYGAPRGSHKKRGPNRNSERLEWPVALVQRAWTTKHHEQQKGTS